jgi:hypothetical protein
MSAATRKTATARRKRSELETTARKPEKRQSRPERKADLAFLLVRHFRFMDRASGGP